MSPIVCLRYKSLIGGEQYEPDEENPMIGFRGCGRYTDPFFEECFAMELEAESSKKMAVEQWNSMLPQNLECLFRCMLGNNHHV